MSEVPVIADDRPDSVTQVGNYRVDGAAPASGTRLNFEPTSPMITIQLPPGIPPPRSGAVVTVNGVANAFGSTLVASVTLP